MPHPRRPTNKNRTHSPSNRPSHKARSAPLAAGLESRRVALLLLRAIMEQGESYADATAKLSGLLHALSSADRHFVQLLVYSVLRRKGGLDDAIAPYLKKPLPGRYSAAEHLLRLGAAQLLLLDTDAHAAVHTSVELAEVEGCGPVKGVLNAVLRRLSESRPKVADNMALPDWLAANWGAAYGADAVNAIEKLLVQEPPLDITVPKDTAAWAEKLGGEVLAAHTVRLQQGGDVPNLPGFEEGAWWVQDIAASLPAYLLGDVKGKRVLDLCAAPGGKTMQLAAAGAKVTALDKSSGRLKRVHENLVRTKLTAEIVATNALKYNTPEAFDAILLDAPCSATGTMRRHPDIAYGKTEDDVAELSELQAQMLDHALSLLKPGGVLVYCVCSLQPEEGETQAQAFLIRQAGKAKLLPLSALEIEGCSTEWVSGEGYLRTLPHYLSEKGGMDGFFAARFEKLK